MSGEMAGLAPNAVGESADKNRKYANSELKMGAVCRVVKDE
jgi:hypothetical protein